MRWVCAANRYSRQRTAERRILFLGGSITLGWGVLEDQTVEAQLQRMLRAAGERVQVLNGGVGNYNTVRYVSRFFKELTGLKPSDIVVQYFPLDAEALDNESGNFLLRNSELAVTLLIAYHRLLDRQGEQSLVDHYGKVYEPSAPGFVAMKRKLHELAGYAKTRGIALYLAMTPDIHDLVDYKFGFIHDRMRQIADDEGYEFIDLLPELLGYPPESLYAMPGDPHPNALAHKLMAETIFPRIAAEQREQKADR
jgi:lysophospholipase L1-like esterase